MDKFLRSCSCVIGMAVLFWMAPHVMWAIKHYRTNSPILFEQMVYVIAQNPDANAFTFESRGYRFEVYRDKKSRKWEVVMTDLYGLRRYRMIGFLDDSDDTRCCLDGGEVGSEREKRAERIRT